MPARAPWFCLSLLLLLAVSSCRSRKAVTSPTPPREKTALRDLSIQKNLRKEVNLWLGTPYRYGGNTQKGVDCSGFVNAVYLSVYHIQLPRSSKEIYARCKKISLRDLQEGDLVFFDYEGKGVSHVGLYLSDGQYVHASTSKGVVISALDNAFSKKKFVGAGRIR